MLTSYFFIAGAFLATIATIGAFVSYTKSKSFALKYLFLVFFFMALHAYAFSLPIIINKGNLKAVAYGYVIGIVSVFILLVLALRVQTFITRKFFKTYANLISIIVGVLGIIVISILLYDLRLPIINSNGIIFWNVNPWASWLTSICCFIYGIVWTYLFYMASNLTKNTYSKVKLLILSADGLLFGSGALFIYTSTNELQSVIGMVLFISACIITAPIFIMPKTSSGE